MKRYGSLSEELLHERGGARGLTAKDIAWIRGHVEQLTQSISQLSLLPSQEEAKKKH